MIRALLIAALAVLACDSADACNRCGLFGRNCRFVHNQVVHAEPAYVQAAVVTPPEVFVVQNNYPAPLAPQGSTVYGYQAAAAAYHVDPAEVLRQSAELTKAASLTAQIGLNGFHDTARTQLSLQASITEPLARGQAAAQVLDAAGFRNQAVQQSQSLALRVYSEGGKWKVEQAEAEQVNAKIEAKVTSRPAGPAANNTTSMLTQKCASCHGLQLAEPKGGLFIDAGHKLDSSVITESIRLVKTGEMPKGGPALSDQEKGMILDELLSLERSE